jgi:septum formation protein
LAESVDFRLTLVSASPRRAELLQQLGVPFDIFPSQASERWITGSGIELAVDNARRKVERSPLYGDRSRLLLGADTVIQVDSRILGKPAGPESAQRMLQLLSGREHEVITGVCLAAPAADPQAPFVSTEAAAVSRVTFHGLSSEKIRSYVRSGEWEGKAGAYAIQGTAGEFVAHLEGEFDNVVGLPVQLIRDLIRQNFLYCRFR